MSKQREATALVARKLWELQGKPTDQDLKNWNDAEQIIKELLSGLMHTADADCRHTTDHNTFYDGYISYVPSPSNDTRDKWYDENYTENGIFKDAF